jgi:hypothetical protein
VGEGFGWLPCQLTLRSSGGQLVAAAPCYLKLNSYGEFVFDWAWADAYRRCGLRYYPKMEDYRTEMHQHSPYKGAGWTGPTSTKLHWFQQHRAPSYFALACLRGRAPVSVPLCPEARHSLQRPKQFGFRLATLSRDLSRVGE